MPALAIFLLAWSLIAAEYHAPAGTRPAARRPGAESILPGGRIIAPLGSQYGTGPGPFGLAVSPNGKMVVSANGGPRRYSLTVLEKDGQYWRAREWSASTSKTPGADEDDWRSVFMGLAFDGNHSLYASEGNSGRVRLIDTRSGKKHQVYALDQDGFRDSYTGDLAFDRKRRLLFVVDQANYRLVTVDTGSKRIAASLRVGRLPFSIALSADGHRAYVSNIGMFEYRPLPGSLPFPAFGFPSPEARGGVRRGSIDVPGLGDPNVRESNSLCVVNVENAAAPRIDAFIRTGLPFGEKSLGGSSPSGVLAAAGRIFVSNANNDSISVIDAATNKLVREIPLRIPGLENLRGILPLGMAYHERSGWVLAAEAGINAIGVIDARQMRVLGHLPAGWFPTRVAVDHDTVYVANAKGHGTGPNADRNDANRESFQGTLRRGSISVFHLPAGPELRKLTARVLELNGFVPSEKDAEALPPDLRHVVLIVKENRTFDEVFGDITKASNGPVEAAPALARFGRRGWAASREAHPTVLQARPIQNVNIAPNHHAMAARWAASDNFYADSEVSVDGHHWLVGSYPNAWTESSLMAAYGGQKDFRLPTTAPGRLQFAQSNSSVHPEEQLEAGAIWHHLERHGISFRNFGEGFELAGVNEGKGLKPTGARYLTNVPMPDPLYRNTSQAYPQFNMNIPDQFRAAQFIQEMEQRYAKGGEPFPTFLFLHLPNDHLAKPRPEDGYPYEASYMADNDYALGRIAEYLTHTPRWRRMAIFITEDDAQGGVDHLDSHRTVLLVLSPYAKRNYMSHVHSSFPGLLKTVFRILSLPPLNLFDATATDLSDCFGGTPDFAPYTALRPDRRVFDPAIAREPLDPIPSPHMDDPRVLLEQHRKMR
jgi:YVTN family beta-propeller protein